MASPDVGGDAGIAASPPLPWVLVVSVAGVVLCYTWYRLVRSYKDLNSGKFKVVHAIESRLPASPYDAEWEAVGRGEDKDLYLPFSHIEIYIPWVFAALYIVLAVWEIVQRGNLTLEVAKPRRPNSLIVGDVWISTTLPH